MQWFSKEQALQGVGWSGHNNLSAVIPQCAVGKPGLLRAAAHGYKFVLAVHIGIVHKDEKASDENTYQRKETTAEVAYALVDLEVSVLGVWTQVLGHTASPWQYGVFKAC